MPKFKVTRQSSSRLEEEKIFEAATEQAARDLAEDECGEDEGWEESYYNNDVSVESVEQLADPTTREEIIALREQAESVAVLNPNQLDLEQ